VIVPATTVALRAVVAQAALAVPARPLTAATNRLKLALWMQPSPR
jgi:hypothetical protein